MERDKEIIDKTAEIINLKDQIQILKRRISSLLPDDKHSATDSPLSQSQSYPMYSQTHSNDVDNTSHDTKTPTK